MRRIVLMFVANLFRLPYMLFKLFCMTGRRQSFTKEERYACLHRFVRWANWGGRVRVEATGVEKLPQNKSYIMFPNHQGLYDTLTMVEAIDRPFSPVAKLETAGVPLLGRVLRMLDAEFLDRKDVRQSLGIIQSVASRVKNGENFVIFPEGTRSKKGNSMNRFKPGAFKAATLSGCDIVPVALVDCFIPFDRPSLKKITVQAHFLDPIPYEQYKDMNTHEIADLVQSRIADTINSVVTARGEEPVTC